MTHLDPDLLLDLALELLPADQAATARAHVETCATCRASLDAVESEHAVLTDVLSSEPASAVADRLAGDVVLAVRQAKSPAPVVAFRWRRWVAAAAGLAITATVAVQIAQRQPIHVEPEQAKQVLIEKVRVSELKALEEEETE